MALHAGCPHLRRQLNTCLLPSSCSLSPSPIPSPSPALLPAGAAPPVVSPPAEPLSPPPPVSNITAVPEACKRTHIDDYASDMPIVLNNGSATDTFCPDDASACAPGCKRAIQRVSPGSLLGRQPVYLRPSVALKRALRQEGTVQRPTRRILCPPAFSPPRPHMPCLVHAANSGTVVNLRLLICSSVPTALHIYARNSGCECCALCCACRPAARGLGCRRLPPWLSPSACERLPLTTVPLHLPTPTSHRDKAMQTCGLQLRMVSL